MMLKDCIQQKQTDVHEDCYQTYPNDCDNYNGCMFCAVAYCEDFEGDYRSEGGRLNAAALTGFHRSRGDVWDAQWWS